MSRKTILLSGYFGFGNCGDELIYSIEKETLARLGFSVYALSENPEEHYEFKRKNLLEVLRAVRASDVVVSGGGGLIQDKTSLNSLIYYVFILFVARLFRKKTACFAQGIGPLHTKVGMFLTRKVLNKTDFISVRDDFSVQELKKCGVKSKIYKTADVAFLLEEEKEMKLPFERFVLFAPGKALKMPAIKTLVEAGKYVEDKTGLPLVVVPLYPARDGKLCSTLSQKLNAPFIVPPSPLHYAYLVGKSDFVVGMRYHSVVLSALKGKAFTALVYDPKVKALADEFGVKVVEDYGNMDFGTFKEVFDFNFARRADIVENLNKKTAELKERALQNFVLFEKTFG